MAECLLSMDILFMGYNSDRCGLALVVPALAIRGSFSLVTVPFNMLHPSYMCTHTHMHTHVTCIPFMKGIGNFL